uniref:Chitin-binding type-2 domain-containing protein n=1 Tax=Daphnia galeata TaxID=27404 RepID=A0A8J2S3C1_9CRUS|nr:unnamed protein product [Daphnia galeata]
MNANSSGFEDTNNCAKKLTRYYHKNTYMMFLRCLLTILVTVAFGTRIQATTTYLKGTDGRVSVCPEDGVYPNYYNCSTFITCSNGIQYVMSCPEGLIWNVDTNKCDWPYNTQCVIYPRNVNSGKLLKLIEEPLGASMVFY